MNSRIEAFARKCILEDVSRLPEGWQETFKRMYGSKNGKLTIEQIKELPMDQVVKAIPCDRLDWALTQIDNSHKKLQQQEQ